MNDRELPLNLSVVSLRKDPERYKPYRELAYLITDKDGRRIALVQRDGVGTDPGDYVRAICRDYGGPTDVDLVTYHATTDDKEVK